MHTAVLGDQPQHSSFRELKDCLNVGKHCFQGVLRVMPVLEPNNLKSTRLHFQQLQAFCALRLNLRWGEQVQKNLLWTSFPILVIPVISRRAAASYAYASWYVWEKTSMGRIKLIAFCCTVLCFPPATGDEDPHLHTHSNMQIHHSGKLPNALYLQFAPRKDLS